MIKTNIDFSEDNSDDYSVLNFLLEHVRGISPSSFSPSLALEDALAEDDSAQNSEVDL